MLYFGKSGKNFFLLEKNPTSSVKIGGIRSRKSFFDFYENLQKISLGKINVPYFGKSAKNFFLLEKNQTSSFKKREFLFKFLMGNRHFFETTSKAKCPDKPRSGDAKSRVSVKAVSAEAVWNPLAKRSALISREAA